MPTKKQEINPYLPEWIRVHEPMNHVECIHLLEERFIQRRLTKLEVIEHILSMLIGFESESFIWNDNEQQFTPTECYSMTNVNLQTYRSFLSKFAPIGTMYRRMSTFVDTEYFRGKTFFAYQNVLGKILAELMEKTLQARQHFTKSSTNIDPDKNVRLILVESFLDSEQNGQLLLSIRNLYAIHQEIIRNDSKNQSSESITISDSFFQMETSLHRYFCRQTLNAIHKRLSIPDIRIRSLAYTMLDHCLRILFISLETMLKSLTSISEISSNEFLFESKFRSKNQLYHNVCKVTEMSKFWHDFLFVDEQFKSLQLFQFESLNLMSEAIKCSFVCRKNHLHMDSLNRFQSIRIIDLFRSIMFRMLKINCQNFDEKLFDIFCDSYETNESIIMDNNNLISEYQKRRFKTYRLPLNTCLNITSILNEALNETFETISRPIVQEFLPELRRRYLRLFNYYTNFFLCQNVQHTLLYMYFLFPILKDQLQRARYRRSFSELDSLMKQIHRSYLQNDDNDNDDNDNGHNYFQPHISLAIQTEKFKNHFNHSNNDFDWIVHSFDIFYFVPSSSSSSTSIIIDKNNNIDLSKKSKRKNKITTTTTTFDELNNFWPLTLMFNAKINDLFNELFQFLLRLRYFQYLIGNDFLLSSKFRYNDLKKNIYLFRFRLANLIFQFGYQMEYRLKELIQQTINRFENDTENVEEFFNVHQKFLEKLEQIKLRVINSVFMRQQFRTIAKFCHTNDSDVQSLTDTIVKNRRRQSIVENINQLDRVRSEDFII